MYLQFTFLKTFILMFYNVNEMRGMLNGAFHLQIMSLHIFHS
jgi:hypothetical protein